MTFKVATVNVDGGVATIVAMDQLTSGPNKVVNVQFPFSPSEKTQEKDKLIAAAKIIIQQALNEI
jgi:hypothetical protein